MATRTGETSATIAAPPDVVFAAISDIDRLPEWNAVMQSVVERPAVLEPGAQWVVAFRALGQGWHSRATLDELDRVERRFAFHSGTDDGNPSNAAWVWKVDEDPAGSRVTVRWELRPVTFWRRVLFVKVRARQLQRIEVPASLLALAAHVERSTRPQ
jgi:uncharacterized protein YndB with AHSA1/START domain